MGSGGCCYQDEGDSEDLDNQTDPAAQPEDSDSDTDDGSDGSDTSDGSSAGRLPGFFETDAEMNMSECSQYSLSILGTDLANAMI